MNKKIITFDNIKIKDLGISENDNEITLSVAYALVEEGNKEWHTKRRTIKDKDLTTAQKKTIQKVLDIVTNKIKSLEDL